MRRPEIEGEERPRHRIRGTGRRPSMEASRECDVWYRLHCSSLRWRRGTSERRQGVLARCPAATRNIADLSNADAHRALHRPRARAHAAAV